MQIMISEQDAWQASGELLQPKRQIGNYVEVEGLRVPHRFDDLEQALAFVASGGTIILRSEHPDEYDGPSGLFESHKINGSIIDEGETLTRQYLNDKNIDIDQETFARQEGSPGTAHGFVDKAQNLIIAQILKTPPEITTQRLRNLESLNIRATTYAALTNRSIEELLEQMSYSFWEYIPGTNVVVVADDVVDDKYHLISNHSRAGMVDPSGKEIRGGLVPLDPENGFARRSIELYESIRNLGRFSSNHCPIMELQVDQRGQSFFLQYHRARDFTPVTERLDPRDYDERDAWIKADAVRGAIDSPSTLQMTLDYPEHYGTQKCERFPTLPKTEEASVGGPSDTLNEVLSRRRQAYITGLRYESLYPRLYDHRGRSRWFKPQVAFAYASAYSNNLYDHIDSMPRYLTAKDGSIARYVINVASDGRDGYLRLDPDHEQPIYDYGTAQ